MSRLCLVHRDVLILLQKQPQTLLLNCVRIKNNEITIFFYSQLLRFTHSSAQPRMEWPTCHAGCECMEWPTCHANVWNGLLAMPMYGMAYLPCQCMEWPTCHANVWNGLLAMPMYGMAYLPCQCMEWPTCQTLLLMPMYGMAYLPCQCMEWPTCHANVCQCMEWPTCHANVWNGLLAMPMYGMAYLPCQLASRRRTSCPRIQFLMNVTDGSQNISKSE